MAVSVHGSASEWIRPLASTICLTIANRSKVLRPSRSMRVTVITSPGLMAFNSGKSCAGRPAPPVNFPRQILLHPALRDCSSCASSVWPWVLTRAKPVVKLRHQRCRLRCTLLSALVGRAAGDLVASNPSCSLRRACAQHAVWDTPPLS